MAWTKPYTLDFGPTGDNIKQGVDKLEDNVDDIYTNLNLLKNTFTGTSAPSNPDTGQTWLDTNVTPTLKYYDGSAWVVPNKLIGNLKLTVNASVNKLDVFSKTGGAAPTTSHAISVMIPDGTGLVLRSRSAAYLSGTSQFIMADATNYWSKGSLDAEIKSAYVYAIWDGTGIVWALAGYSGFNMVPTSTTATDDDFFLLEASSTYTRSNSHYCVCVGRVRYQYDTADTPDYTIQATVEESPRVIWNPKSDYGRTLNLATTTTSASDIANGSVVSVVVKQPGRYLINARMQAETTATTSAGSSYWYCFVEIRTGSATFGSATLKSHGLHQVPVIAGQPSYAVPSVTSMVYLNTGDTIHLGGSVFAESTGNRIIGGDNMFTGATQLTFQKLN